MKISERLNEITEELRKHSQDYKLADVLRERLAQAGLTVPRGDLSVTATRVHSKLFESGSLDKSRVELNPNFLLKLADSSAAPARKLAAALLPEKFLRKFVSDDDASVLYETARRCNALLMREIMLKNPDDENLYSMFLERFGPSEEDKTDRVKKISDHMSDKYSTVMTYPEDRATELSDTWYFSAAYKLIQDYGRNIEGRWEELAVDRYAKSMQSVYGVQIDAQKLLDAIVDAQRAREDEILERDALREASCRLAFDVLDEDLKREETREREDLVESLLREHCSVESFIRSAASVFDVRESSLPRALARLTEAKRGLSVPVSGELPEGRYFDERVDAALDKFVKCWNESISRSGQNVVLDWVPESCDSTRVKFSVSAR